MATPLPLEGDGLVENLFHYLWTTDDLGGGPRVSVPPTVVYRGSQPVAWYFTSRKSGRIKRKHRANLTAAHIEHSFTKRKALTDIVAYYIYLPKAVSTNPAIEYFDAEALREFLFKRPEIPHSSPGSLQSAGILQQLALPKGACNSTLRAIWSPKLCLLERRINMHAIHDARFSVYERGVTFEEGGGAEALSRPEPVRGSMLPGMVQQLCERVVDHVTRVSYHKFRIARMVLRLQVDADDRLWLLWSSSLRLQPPLAPATPLSPDMPSGEAGIRPLDIVSDAKVPTFAFAQGSGGGPVSLTSTSSPEMDEDPRSGQTRCASCAQLVAHRALLPTTYKAVLAHFQQVLKFLRERVNEENQVAIEWPPHDRVVQQAGGVGFGILRHLKSVGSSSDDSGMAKVGSGMRMWQGRELLVPPVIRYLHPTLRAEDFARHRHDPIFLHKTVGVCERCCLVYADYATASLEANALGIRSSASAPALLRPVREKPKHTEYFDDESPDSLALTTAHLNSPLPRGTSKTKPPASAWKPVTNDDSQRRKSVKYRVGHRSTLHSLPIAPMLPPRIETFEPGDNDALRIPDGLLDDGSPQHQQQQREEAFFRELYQQKDTVKRGGHALRHILEAADCLSKAKPQHRLAALGDSSQIGQSQSTGALVGAITELKLGKKPGKSPYSVVQRIRGAESGKIQSKNQAADNASPVKSLIKSKVKHAKKSRSKQAQEKSESGAERSRFISSREKRAAAAHRGYLVAALSDAQVQTLASLVIPTAPAIDAASIEHDTEEALYLQKRKSDHVEKSSTMHEDDQISQVIEQKQEQELVDYDEGNDHDQEHFETQPNDQEYEDVLVDPTFQLENRERQVQQKGERAELEHDQDGDNKTASISFEPDTALMHGETNVIDDEQDIIQDGECFEAQTNVTAPLKNAESILEERQNEIQLLSDEQGECKPDLPHKDEHVDYQPYQIKMPDEESRFSLVDEDEIKQPEHVEHQEDEAQDEYQDEYEDPDLEIEQRHRNKEDQDHHHNFVPPVEANNLTAHNEAVPEHHFLEEAHELIATALSSVSVDADDSSNEHKIGQDHDDNGGNSGRSILSPQPPPLTALENDSSDDAVIEADTAVAAAIALPLSDESSSATSDK
ncbi:unnamed protein product [Phytophthora lilii]|uniref:Unnamed protein product n=1 Tax=Phytophthora lilii TaxID=2077276 RepID=A0A9W6THC1_9STRA|nr:unnamed protein product [Phytophthora lilii]